MIETKVCCGCYSGQKVSSSLDGITEVECCSDKPIEIYEKSALHRTEIQTPNGPMVVLSLKALTVDSNKLQRIADNAVRIDVDEMGKVSEEDPVVNEFKPGTGMVKKYPYEELRKAREEQKDVLFTDKHLTKIVTAATQTKLGFFGRIGKAVKIIFSGE